MTLRNIRLQKGLTQEQLASLAGIGQAHVSHLECGRRNLTLRIAKKLAKALNVPVTILIQTEEKVASATKKEEG
jgi:transcriptional regulator with XRE-family HTH domain